MTDKLPADVIRTVSDLEALIRATPSTARLELQGDLHRLCERLVRDGYEVPQRLMELDSILTDAMLEAQFDNLPV